MSRNAMNIEIGFITYSIIGRSVVSSPVEKVAAVVSPSARATAYPSPSTTTASLATGRYRQYHTFMPISSLVVSTK